MLKLFYQEDAMLQEDYSKLVAAILTLSYQQQLSLRTVLDESLKEKTRSPELITGLSSDEIHSQLDEAYESMKNERCYSADEVDAMLKDELGI